MKVKTPKTRALRLARFPLWMRLTALMCVLFFTVGAVAQSAHNHASLASPSSKSKPSHSTQNDCQLCMAMHSALSTPTQVAPEPVAFQRHFSAVTSEIARAFLWRSVLACRPPPAQTPAVLSQVIAAA